MKTLYILGITVAAALMTTSAFAQAKLGQSTTQNDKIDAIQESVADGFDKFNDADRFGTERFRQGWTGSLSAGFSATPGRTDTRDLSIAGRFNYGQGDWNHIIGFAVETAESAGVKSKDDAFVRLESDRYFNDSFYVFGLVSATFDAFDTLEQDVFIGFGPGYRIVNTADTAWRVQAGPGYRFTKTNAGVKANEAAFLASSRLYHKFNENIFITNDTDILHSETGTAATNDFGVSFRISNNMATRVSYTSEFKDVSLTGAKNTDNKLGMSVVYSF